MHTLSSSFAQFEERVKGLSLTQISTPEGVAWQGFYRRVLRLKTGKAIIILSAKHAIGTDWESGF
jgi:hypothetical protein